MAMVANFKATRLILNELWRAGFLNLQVPRARQKQKLCARVMIAVRGSVSL